MAKYSIKAPDGFTYDIEGPEGATDDEVIGAVLAEHPYAGYPQAPEPTGQDAPTPKGVDPLAGAVAGTPAPAPQSNIPDAVGAEYNPDNYTLGGAYEHAKQRGGGYGITEENRQKLGDGVVADIFDYGAVPFQAVGYGAEALAGGADELARSILGEDTNFLPGSGFMAAGEALPLGGLEAGIVAPNLGRKVAGDITPESPAPAPTRFTPEVEAGWAEALGSGDLETAMRYAIENKINVNPADVMSYQEALRKGEAQAPYTRYREDGETTPLEQEAEAFKPKAEPTAEDLFPTEESLKAKEAALEAKLQQEADAFKNGNEPAPEAPASERVTGIVDHANAQLEQWENGPEVSVHDNFKDVDGLDNDALGAYDAETGQVHLNAAAIEREAKHRKLTVQEMTNTVLFHEGLGHYGLAQKFRTDLDATLTKWYGNSTFFKRKVDQWLEKNAGAYADEDQIARAGEEVLAEMSEKGQLPASMINTIKNQIKDFARQMGIKLDYSAREIRTILAHAHKGVKKGQKAEASGYGRRNMFAGENSQSAPPQDSSRWFDSDDGKRKYEINDRDTRFSPEVFQELLDEHNKAPDDGVFVALGSILDHPELYRAYPDLDSLKVRIEGDTRNLGSYSESLDTIRLNPKETPEQMHSTLLHEVQHAIQAREDFARGGNPDYAVMSMDDDHLKSTVRNLQKYGWEEKAKLERAYDVYEEAIDHPTYKEAREISDRYREASKKANAEYDRLKKTYGNDYNPYMRDARSEVWQQLSKESGALSLEVLEAKKRLYKELGFPEGVKFDDLPPDARKFKSDIDTSFYKDKPDALLDDLRRQIDKLEDLDRDDEHALVSGKRADLIRSVSKYRSLKFDVPFQAYQNLLGEVEARSVQDRHMFTDAERDATGPYDTQAKTSPRDEHIVVRPTRKLPTPPSANNMRNMKSTYGESEGTLQGRAAMEDVDDATVINKMRSNRPVDGLFEEFAPEKEKQTWGEWASEAERMKMTDRMARSIAAGANPAELKAAEMHALKLANSISDLSRKAANETLSPKEQALLTQWTESFEQVNQAISDVVANAARLLNSRKMEVATDQTLSQRLLRRMLSSMTDAERAALGTPEGAKKFAEKLVRERKKAERIEKSVQVMGNILNFTRSLWSSFDLSAPFRQGRALAHTSEFWKNIPAMFKYWGNETFYNMTMDEIKSRPNYGKMEKAGLAFTELGSDLSKREEQFMSSWADKIPGVKQSARAYNGYLNKLRADVFDRMAQELDDAGVDLQKDPKVLKDLARFVNSATGRGSLGQFNQAAPVLAGVLFSPRLMASRINMLNPAYYMKLSPPVRKQAIKSLLAFGTTSVLFAKLAAEAGMDVEWDPRSSDFMKLKKGDTRYDILGGFGQYLTLGARLATNQKKNAKGGVVDLGKRFGSDDALDVLTNFLRSKFSPNASLVVDARLGKNVIGEEFNLQDETVKRFIPLFFQDVSDAIKEKGAAEGVATSVPGFFGVGAQTYPAPEGTDEFGRTFDKERVDTPVITEIKRLGGVNPPRQTVRVDGKSVKIPDKTYHKYTELTGQYLTEAMTQVMERPEWQQADDELKEEVLRELHREAKKMAREELFNEQPDEQDEEEIEE